MQPTDDKNAGVLHIVQDGIAHIVLNRPQRRNAIDLDMRAQLLAAIQASGHAEHVRAVILRGAGEHFCSGGDTSTMGQGVMPAEQGRARMLSIVACARALLELPKPVIAAVDGVAYGGGFGLSLCADLIVATPRARFCLPFMRIGLVPDFATLFTLPRLVGLQRARQLIYTAREIDGVTAHDDGLVAELSDPAMLQSRAEELAAAMCHLPATAFALTKQTLLRTFSTDHAVIGDIEAMAQGMAFNTDAHRQAIERARNKQPPLYRYPPVDQEQA